jgi:hypothetical protein
MGLVKKTAPQIDDPVLQRVIRQLYDDINEIIDRLGEETAQDISPAGRVGEIRVVKTATDTYEVQVRHGEGWLVSEQFTLQTKE